MSTEKSNKKLEGIKKREANLRPAKKGEVRNPKGRPKKEHCIPDILRRILAESSPYDPEEKRTILDEILFKAAVQAMGGDKDARSFIADRTEGKALERIKNYDGIDELEIF